MVFATMTYAVPRAFLAALFQGSGETSWFPVQNSTTGDSVDGLFFFILYLSLFFFVGIVGFTIYFTIRYRKREGYVQQKSAEHNTALELTWSIIPSILLVVMFFWGYKGFLASKVVPDNSYQINVFAKQWDWQFVYPDGTATNELHVPKGQPVRLFMSSADVLHSMFIPSMRVKQDLVPGRYTECWFEARETGEWEHGVVCAEYCGTRHSDMFSKLVVHEKADFDAWLAAEGDILSKLPPKEAGKVLFQRKHGCVGCHSLQGIRIVGPPLNGIFGKKHKMADGSEVLVDEAYLRESIYEPGKKIVATYTNGMTSTFKNTMSEQELLAIIEFLKDLK